MMITNMGKYENAIIIMLMFIIIMNYYVKDLRDDNNQGFWVFGWSFRCGLATDAHAGESRCQADSLYLPHFQAAPPDTETTAVAPSCLDDAPALVNPSESNRCYSHRRLLFLRSLLPSRTVSMQTLQFPFSS